jgi:hypothetical protein
MFSKVERIPIDEGFSQFHGGTMIISKKRLRIPTSVLLALSVAATFTFSSFAAPSLPEKTDTPVQVQQGPTGTLTARGPVTVNGNEAKTGMTVLTQSVITTGSGGQASIELGPLGRVELAQQTTVTLQLAGSLVQATLNQCGRVTVSVPAGVTGQVTIPQQEKTHVKVVQGKVTVRYGGGKDKTVVAGEDKEFDDATEVTSDGGAAIFEVYCGHKRPIGYYFLASPLALLLLLLRDTDNPTPPVLSPVVPG